MPWYTAKCEFKSVHSGDEPQQERIGEYRFFLFNEVDEISARNAAETLGSQREHSYKNIHDTAVQWKFEKIIDIKELFAEDIRSGTEVYFEYFTPSIDEGT